MADLDWAKIAVEAGVPLISGTVGVLIGLWNWGRNSANAEHEVKTDFQKKLDALREETRSAMASYEKAATARNDLLVEQFKESFDGIRRQIDENRLDSERRYLAKNDFAEWRKEYREDMRDIKESIAEIAAKH